MNNNNNNKNNMRRMNNGVEKNNNRYNNNNNNVYNRYAENAYYQVPPLRRLVQKELYKSTPSYTKNFQNQQSLNYTGMSIAQLTQLSEHMTIYVKKIMKNMNNRRPIFSLVLRPKQFPLDKANNTWKYNPTTERFIRHS